MKLNFWGRSAAPAPAAPATTALAEVRTTKPPRRSWMARSLATLFKAAEEAGNDKWTTMPTAPDDFITRSHTVLVARSREQWANNDYAMAFQRLIRQNVVGPIGVTYQAKATTPRGKLDKDANAALEADWCEWGEKGNCDVTGKLTFREIQALAVETAARDGEYIIRLVYGADAGPHGFAVQFIDPQRLPVWHDVINYNGGGFIRHGVEFNSYGRPVAYHFTSTSEGDPTYYNHAGRGFVRVPADEIIHEFIVEMVGQRRGLPWTRTTLKRLRNINGFEDAAVQNARAGASTMGFIQYREGTGPELDDNEELNIQAEPLKFQELPEGAELKEFKPQFPSGETAPFIKSQLRGAASGMGVPYNELANDLEGVNFSSIRQLTLDAREHYKEIQQWMIDGLVKRVRDAHLRLRLLQGAIKVKGQPLAADKLPVYRQCTWQPRRWAWIDPRADVDSAVQSIRAGLISPSTVIREQGRDPETVFQELAADLQAMKAHGIPEEIIHQFFFGVAPPPPKPEAPPKANNE
jgi:lambda family phage portal protein